MNGTEVERGAAAPEAALEAPSAAPRGRVAERWAPLVAGLLLALPTLIAAYPPATDLPMHEAQVSLLRHFRDPTMFPPGMYQLNLGHPNQLFHVVAYLLSFALGVTLACRVVLAATVIAVPLGAARLADHLRVSRWTAVLVAPVAIGWLFFLGLIANLIGLALFLALLPTLDRFVESPTPRGAWSVAGACLALYFGHEAMLFIFAGTLLLFTILRPMPWRPTALRLVPFAFAIAITVGQLEWQKHLFTRAKNTSTLWVPLWAKLAGAPTCLFSNYDADGARAIFALVAVAMAAGAMGRARAARASSRGAPVTGIVARAHRARFELVALTCVVGYLTAPGFLNGASFVYHRFLPPAYALLAILCAPRAPEGEAPRARASTMLLCAVAPLAALLVVWPAYVESDRNFREVSSLMPLIEKDSSVAILATTRDYTGYARSSFGEFALAQRGGRILFSFSESPIAPVRLRGDLLWEEPIKRASSLNFCPAWDFTRFRYLLFDSPDPQVMMLARSAVRPEARMIGERGEWALFESTLPVVPIESRDARPPAQCRTDTLGARLDAASDAMEKAWREHPIPGVTPMIPRHAR